MTRPDLAAFATAIQPDVADTVQRTDDAGLATGDIRIPVPGGELPAYHAAPATPGPHPVVLLVQEIFGVHEHIRDVARRLAKLGYLAVAPELFFRSGDPKRAPSMEALRSDFVGQADDARVAADLDAALDWALAHGGDENRVGITGFCWGGRATWLYAAHQPRLKAAVAWYGRLTGERTARNPQHPADVAGHLHAPVLGLYGGADTLIPLAAVDELRAALAAASDGRGRDSTVHVYPDAPHAFYADYRASYRAAEAVDGWARMQAWFAQHGVA
ncbi:dienelactone hydrolase family protein [Azoarcus olearius]|uniref:Carboxymethylenebutenolidase n=1 Tax=Azoarcus sp. (strain BH72) TaxID=418699 RepID=A1K8V9_AZOSB|nr:dienelactone hydrolase family protein [Azoarcus olearius]CAL95264.1 putative carboxymethylenebutenolidase [Azoarcus olearius]